MDQPTPLGTCEHIVHLTDSPLSAARALAAFVREGFQNGDVILVVARPETWNLAAVELAGERAWLPKAVADGRIVVRDSTRTLAACLAGEMPEAARFETAVASLVRNCAARGGRLRVYGDMVDVLAGDGRFEAAARLEELWNELATRVSFTLLCGYSSSHFTHDADASALNTICGLHSRHDCDAQDVAAQQLLSASH